MSDPVLAIEIEEPRGFPDTIANDLERAEATESSLCRIEWLPGPSTVEIEAETHVAARWLSEWLEESMRHYAESRESYGELRACEQLHEAVQDERGVRE